MESFVRKNFRVGQGHPGSVFSMVDIVTTLFHNSYRFDEKTKKFIDRIIISKGHATVALYPILKEFGVIDEKEWKNWGKKDKIQYLESLEILQSRN